MIDNLKVQFNEDKGPAVATTDNHIAQLLFMLSHYMADAHIPPALRYRKGCNR